MEYRERCLAAAASYRFGLRGLVCDVHMTWGSQSSAIRGVRISGSRGRVARKDRRPRSPQYRGQKRGVAKRGKEMKGEDPGENDSSALDAFRRAYVPAPRSLQSSRMLQR